MKEDQDFSYLKKEAEDTLAEIAAFERSGLRELDCPGIFTFSHGHHRITVKNMDELHEARKILRGNYGWKDSISNKFFSQGRVIAVYRPDNPETLPVPFSLWLESPPEEFPQEVLGTCKLVERQAKEYDVVCEL